jgi:Protein of unknown function (DUF1569)
MALPNIFEKNVSDEIVQRINQLNSSTQANWGKMNAAQMLAHCSVTYEMAYEDIHPKPNAFIKFILKLMVKKNVVNEAPYKHNSQTSPQFLIKDSRDFDKEKSRLVEYINKTQALGEMHFNNRESHSFGVLSKVEWNNLFYKHLNHHLSQFGV